MIDDAAPTCIRLFREKAGLNNTPAGVSLSDEQVLSAPIGSFDMDSLDTMEFIMAIEDRFNIELNEEAVNSCRNLRELVDLTETARRV